MVLLKYWRGNWHLFPIKKWKLKKFKLFVTFNPNERWEYHIHPLCFCCPIIHHIFTECKNGKKTEQSFSGCLPVLFYSGYQQSVHNHVHLSAFSDCWNDAEPWCVIFNAFSISLCEGIDFSGFQNFSQLRYSSGPLSTGKYLAHSRVLP